MNLTVNGETREVADGASVDALIADMGLAGRAVAVEVNKELVPKRRHGETTLNEGDVVEVVSLVGGG